MVEFVSLRAKINRKRKGQERVLKDLVHYDIFGLPLLQELRLIKEIISGATFPSSFNPPTYQKEFKASVISVLISANSF